MWKIGNVSIPNRIAAAPLAGTSNPVYRKLCHDCGAGLVVSEMISDKALHYENRRTQDMCTTFSGEHPVSLQLFGADPDTMAEAAAYLCRHTDCDLIDINMGCPAPKVIRAHAGSYLMQFPEKAFAIAEAVVRNSDRPVTAKIRAGWDREHINCVEMAQGLEKAGISAIAVHGRTRSQMYEGKSNNQYIRMVKEAVSIPVMGNGDIRSLADAERMFAETGVDAVMVGRGFMGRPFFVQELAAGLEGREYIMPTYDERLDMALQYAEDLCAYEGEHIAMRMMRGMAAWYIAGMPYASSYKNRLSYIETMADMRVIITDYRTHLHQSAQETLCHSSQTGL